MDTLAIILSLVLVGGTLALILYPLWRQPQTRSRDASGRTAEELEARYQASLASIRDLMFDFEVGKVTQEDYDVLLTKSKLEAAQIRRQIDQMSQQADVDLNPNIDAEIEKLVAQLKNSPTNGNEPLLKEVNKEIEILKHAQHDTLTCPNCSSIAQIGDTFCSSCGQSLENVKVDKNICPECGTAIQPDDAFCAKCGTELNNNLATRNPQTVDTE